MFSFFNINKIKEKEAKLDALRLNLKDELSRTTSVQEENSKLHTSVFEITWENHELNEQLKQLVLDNERSKHFECSKFCFTHAGINKLAEIVFDDSQPLNRQCKHLSIFTY